MNSVLPVVNFVGGFEFYIDLQGTLLGLVFMAWVLFMFITHYALLAELRKRGLDLPFMLWGSQLFFLQFDYLKNRKTLGEPRLDRLARATIAAPFVALVIILALIKLWPARA
jgi:hypothetical protein